MLGRRSSDFSIAHIKPPTNGKLIEHVAFDVSKQSLQQMKKINTSGWADNLKAYIYLVNQSAYPEKFKAKLSSLKLKPVTAENFNTPDPKASPTTTSLSPTVSLGAQLSPITTNIFHQVAASKFFLSPRLQAVQALASSGGAQQVSSMSALSPASSSVALGDANPLVQSSVSNELPAIEGKFVASWVKVVNEPRVTLPASGSQEPSASLKTAKPNTSKASSIEEQPHTAAPSASVTIKKT